MSDLGLRRGRFDLRCWRFILRLQGIQLGNLVLDGVDAVALGLTVGVELGRVVGQRVAHGLRLGALDNSVVAAAKLRFQRFAFAVQSVFLLDNF